MTQLQSNTTDRPLLRRNSPIGAPGCFPDSWGPSGQR